MTAVTNYISLNHLKAYKYILFFILIKILGIFSESNLLLVRTFIHNGHDNILDSTTGAGFNVQNTLGRLCISRSHLPFDNWQTKKFTQMSHDYYYSHYI